MTREKEIERYLVKQVEKAGGKAYKWVSPGNSGVPDRIVMFLNGVSLGVELKAPGRHLSQKQILRHMELQRFGWWIHVIDSKEKVDELIQRYAG